MSNTPNPPENAATTAPAQDYTAAYQARLAEAVRVLTEAAQLPRPRLRRTDVGTWVEDPDGEHEQTDFADFIAGAITATAANMGGCEALLAGRSGSWEADLVRQLVAGTAGYDDEHLWGYRTTPLAMTLYVEEIVSDSSWARGEERDTMDYFAAADELDRRYQAAEADLPEVYTRDRIWKYARNDAGELVGTDPDTPAWDIEAWRALPSTQRLSEKDRAYFEACFTGAEHDLLPFPDMYPQGAYLPKSAELDEEITRLEEANDARLAPFGELEERLEAQRVRELTEYGRALKSRIEALAALKGLDVPVNVEINIEGFRPHSAGQPAGLEEELLEAAIQDTPSPVDLPGTPLERLERALAQENGDDQ